MADALMVSSSFLPGRGGIESYLVELCTELQPRLAVLAPAKREGKSIPQDLGFDAWGYDGSMLVPSKQVAEAVIERARTLGTDKILFGTPWPLVLIGPRLKAAGLRYAVIIHGAEMLVPSVVPLARARLARSLASAELLLPVSEYTADKLRHYLARRRRRIPPMCILRARVDMNRFHLGAAGPETRRDLGLPEGPLLLTFGRLVKRKGVERAVRASIEIRRRVPGATLAVAGTGPEMKRLRKLATRSDAPVRFLGRVADEDAGALYATADVFLLPVVDRYFGLEIEGLGVVLLEAGAAETPSVTGRSGGTPEAVIHGETGYVIDAREQDELVETVVGLLTDEATRIRMGKAARRHVARGFSTGRIPTALLDWLGDVG